MLVKIEFHISFEEEKLGYFVVMISFCSLLFAYSSVEIARHCHSLSLLFFIFSVPFFDELHTLKSALAFPTFTPFVSSPSFFFFESHPSSNLFIYSRGRVRSWWVDARLHVAEERRPLAMATVHGGHVVSLG